MIRAFLSYNLLYLYFFEKSMVYNCVISGHIVLFLYFVFSFDIIFMLYDLASPKNEISDRTPDDTPPQMKHLNTGIRLSPK